MKVGTQFRERSGACTFLVFWGLLVVTACSPPEAMDKMAVPVPFDHLPGLSLGITTDSLLKVRPAAEESEVWDYSDSLPPWSLTFRPRLGWLTGLGLWPKRIEMIAAHRPLWPSDTAIGGLIRLLKPQPDDEIGCAMRPYYPDTLLVWTRVTGDHEFAAKVRPEHVIRHRDGVDTVAASTTIVWRERGADREHQNPVPCPDTTVQN